LGGGLHPDHGDRFRWAALLVTGWTSLVRRFAVWLGTKPTWNDGLRAEAVFLFMISPMVLLVAIGIIATSH